jgi:aspartyl-tRNA(Asn)/glutamyl-tRNA(Gln) amidotransferase subunit C
MSISRETAAQVAKLARLQLSEEELSSLAGQLSAILDYVAVLDELDVDALEPMVHAVELSNVLRPDELRPSLPRQAALANAPKTDGKYFLVPAIIEG